MPFFTQSSFRAAGVHSLCWRGDEHVDWVGGGRAFALDGTERDTRVRYGYRFDAATASPDGRHAVIYERLGTKAVLLDDGRIVRELNRSFNFADAYEYPVVLFNDPDGRLLLAHCPESYGRLELEDATTGQRLTASPERKPPGVFHSRLAASPGGKRLLSAGWLWHPLDTITWFDVRQALADPFHLDRSGRLPYEFNPYVAEESSGCWLDDDRIAVAASTEPEGDEIEADIEPRLHPSGIAVCDVAGPACVRAFQLDEPAGIIHGLGTRYVLSLYRHPKLIDLSTGKIVHTWTELQSGLQIRSIMLDLSGDGMPPPMAFDSARQRFAIVNEDIVTVIDFNLATHEMDR